MAGISEADRALAMLVEAIPASDWLVVLPVAVPIAAGGFLLVLRGALRLQAAAAAVALFGVLVATALLLGRVLVSGPAVMVMGNWRPPFGIVFAADALGAVFALSASLVAFLCALYSWRDIDVSGRRYGFYPFLMLLTAGVNGAFLTGDVFNLYVWFEVFVVSSFGLLVLGSRPVQLDGAVKYAILNLVATTLFLVSVALLYGATGSLNMADLMNRGVPTASPAPFAAIATLFLFAFAMKAAAFPLNFWLPASYHTPNVVTAALFGGLLTKVGIYAILRVVGMVLLPWGAELAALTASLAAATIVLGALGALAQNDIRRMAGFLVISGVGTMLAGVAMNSVGGFAGTAFYAAQSMIAMTGLYLVVALMQERAGTPNLTELGGLYGKAPLLSAIAFFLFLAVSGLPPAAGLWPKVMLVEEALALGWWWLAFAILLGSLLTTIAVMRVFALAFWRLAPDPPRAAAPGNPMPVLGIVVVLALCAPLLWAGLFPETAARVSQVAGAALVDPATYVRAVLGHGAGP